MNEKHFCPICKNPAEAGFLSGNSSYITHDVSTGFREMEWFAGVPGAMKRLTTLGENVGKANYIQGPYVTGIRCNSCKKIVLDI